MGVSVKNGDFLFLLLNGIVGNTVRLNVNLKPAAAWQGKLMAASKAAGPSGHDPFNLNLDVVCTTDRSLAAGFLRLDFDGEIESASVVNILGTNPSGPGQIYAFAGLARGAAGSGQYAVLTAGYLGGQIPLVFPNGVPRGPLEGPGRMVSTVLPAPAAGADYANVAVPTNANVKVHGAHGALTTAVAAANRRPAMRFFDAIPTEFSAAVSGAVQAASLVVDYDYSRLGMGSANNDFAVPTGGRVQISVPDTRMLAGYVVGFATGNLQAADQWAAGNLEWEEWIQP